MISVESVPYRELRQFIDGSPSGFLQLLVAAAQRSTFARIVDCPTYPSPVKSRALGAALEQFKEATTRPDVHVPTLLAHLYASVRNQAHRKRAGQFFTSAGVANWVVSLADVRADDDVCDAGAGAGAFASAIAATPAGVASYVGVENDATLALCTAHVLESVRAPSSFRVWYANFLLLDSDAFAAHGCRLPSVVISNPPFVRAWDLKSRVKVQAALRAESGLRVPHLSGAANYFLLRAAALSRRGVVDDERGPRRLLFLSPREAAGAAHAKKLRADLQRVWSYAWSDYAIPSSEPGTDRRASNTLALCFVFERQTVPNDETKAVQVAARLGDYVRIGRGISTGCNEYFVLSDADARLHGLPRNRLVKVLPTRIPIARNELSVELWESLRAEGHACWLLALPNARLGEFEAAVQSYLREGIRRGLHTTPTARRLRNWFSLPIPATPPDMFVTYLFRGTPRFILNSARVHNLTNILGCRFLQPAPSLERARARVRSVNKQAERWTAAELGGREYRHGLRKVEPRELLSLPVDPAGLRSAWGRPDSKTPSPSLFD